MFSIEPPRSHFYFNFHIFYLNEQKQENAVRSKLCSRLNERQKDFNQVKLNKISLHSDSTSACTRMTFMHFPSRHCVRRSSNIRRRELKRNNPIFCFLLLWRIWSGVLMWFIRSAIKYSTQIATRLLPDCLRRRQFNLFGPLGSH